MGLQPEISILLPVYNGEEFVASAIDSILNQDFSNFELIIINDGSTDNTINVLHGFSDPRIKIINQANLGIAKALNNGLASSKAPFIARMDADDWSYPNRLRLQYDFLKSNPAIDIVSGMVIYDGDTVAQQGYYLYCQWINSLVKPEAIYLNRFVDSPIAHPSILMKKSILTTYGNYNEGKVPEDYELWLRLLQNGIRIAKIQQPVIKWRDYHFRLSRKHKNYDTTSFYSIKSQYLSHWLHRKFKRLPEMWIWGTGKSVLAKSAYLKPHKVYIKKYIEVKQEPIGNKNYPTIHYSAIPPPVSGIFILSYVSDRIGKKDIFNHLVEKGYVHGENFIMMA